MGRLWNLALAAWNGGLSVLCLILALMLAWDSLFADRRTVEGVVHGTRIQRDTGGRWDDDLLVVTVEGQPYAFTREVGWFDSRDGMQAAVMTGQRASILVVAADLRPIPSHPRVEPRVPILALEQHGRTVFGWWPELMTRGFGVVVLLAMTGTLWARAVRRFRRGG